MTVPGVYSPSQGDPFAATIRAAAESDGVGAIPTWAEGILDDAAYDVAIAAGELSIACDGIDRLRYFRGKLKCALEAYRDKRQEALNALRVLEGED